MKKARQELQRALSDRYGRKIEVHIFADLFDITDEKKYGELISLVLNNNYLKPNGVFILEHQARLKLEHPQISTTRKYGNLSFSFFNPLETEESLETNE